MRGDVQLTHRAFLSIEVWRDCLEAISAVGALEGELHRPDPQYRVSTIGASRSPIG